MFRPASGHILFMRTRTHTQARDLEREVTTTQFGHHMWLHNARQRFRATLVVWCGNSTKLPSSVFHHLCTVHPDPTFMHRLCRGRDISPHQPCRIRSTLIHSNWTRNSAPELINISHRCNIAVSTLLSAVVLIRHARTPGDSALTVIMEWWIVVW